MIGAASQHIISAKRVWRTALKDHRAGVVAGTHINAMICSDCLLHEGTPRLTLGYTRCKK